MIFVDFLKLSVILKVLQRDRYVTFAGGEVRLFAWADDGGDVFSDYYMH